MKERVQFIDNAGDCIASKNIMSKYGKLKWCKRESPVDKEDNGWRFFSDIDTVEYIDNPNNLGIYDFNSVAHIEPAILAIYDFPFGAVLELFEKNNRLFFRDDLTGEIYPVE